MIEGFTAKKGIFCGVEATLVTPDNITSKFTKDNLQHRSIVYSENGDVLSCGFFKFFNYSEQPDLYPNPNDHKDWTIDNKEDGSLCIADFLNDEFSMRTRGTFSYRQLENSGDFELMPENARAAVIANPDCSFLFELTTPNRQIVVTYKEVKFTLLGVMNKKTLVYWTAEELDSLGFPRPEVYRFDNLEELVAEVSTWQGKEGVVLSYNNNQNRVKIKSIWYRALHGILSGLNSDKNIVKLIVSGNHRTVGEVGTTVDFETLTYMEERLKKILPIWEKFDILAARVKEDLAAQGESRKEKALWAQTLPDAERKYAFMLISGKEITDKFLIDYFLDELPA